MTLRKLFILMNCLMFTHAAKPIVVLVGHQDGTTVVDAGAIFRAALKADAEEIIIAHNHPSGDLNPSHGGCCGDKRAG